VIVVTSVRRGTCRRSRPRFAGRVAEFVGRREVVEFDHDAVDLVIEVVPFGQQVVAVLDCGVDVGSAVGEVVDVEPPRAEAVAGGPLGGGVIDSSIASLEGHDVVDETVQRAVGDDPRIELTDRPRGRISGIRKGFLPGFDAFAVVFPKAVFRHEHLTADSQPGGRVAAESLRDRPNPAGLCGHVVARLAVAAGRRADEPAVLVEQFDRDAVEFRLTDVVDILWVERRIAEPAGGAVGELPYVGCLATLGDREHRRGVFDRLKFVNRLAADAVGRAVGRGEIKLGFERLEAVEQLIVNAVGDQRVVVDVIAVVVFPYCRAELGGLPFGLVG